MSKNSKYKSTEIFNLLTYLKNIFPNSANIVAQYSSAFQNLDLSQENCDYSVGEVYIQSINLVTNDTIYLIWNVDDIIQYIEEHHVPSQVVSPLQILQNSRFKLPDYLKTLKKVQKNKFPFPHKVNYVIFAELPCFPGITIIDGNHRFCEAIVSQKDIKAYFLSPHAASLFLQHDSQKFITLFEELTNKLERLS